MTEIERKALALVHSVSDYEAADLDDAQFCDVVEALCRAIEKHEAFKQEVSDAVVKLNRYWERCEPAKEDFYARFDRFIIPKPVDPLVEVLDECGFGVSSNAADDIRAAIEKRGGKIVWGEGA